MNIFGLTFFNDFKRIPEVEIVQEIERSTRLTTVFIGLLAGSAVICTLGLLLNNAAFVIGGMIISPVIWPITKLSLGIANGRFIYIRDALTLLILSIIVLVISSAVVAWVSPLKTITPEILARTTPTLLDVVIALVAGSVAAVAITHPRISSALAGVALATSVTPPLAASAIGLALLQPSVFFGSFLLFAANLIAILFSGIVVYSLIGVERLSSSKLRTKGIIFSGALLAVVVIPLFFLLSSYVFVSDAYVDAERVLQEELQEVSRLAEVGNVSVRILPRAENAVAVEADVFLPESVTIDFEDKNRLIASLEEALGRNVDLRLRIQRVLSVVSLDDQQQQAAAQMLRDSLRQIINELPGKMTISRADFSYEAEEEVWFASVVLRGDLSASISRDDLALIETRLSESIDQRVELDLEISARLEITEQQSTDEAQLSSQPSTIND